MYICNLEEVRNPFEVISMGVHGKHIFQNDSALDSILDLFDYGAKKILAKTIKRKNQLSELDSSNIIVAGALIDGILNSTKYPYANNEFNKFVKKYKNLSVKKYIPNLIILLTTTITDSSLNKYMLLSTVYSQWKMQVIELIERITLNELGLVKPGIQIIIDSEDLLNKLKISPPNGEYVLTVNRLNKKTKIELLTLSNKDLLLSKFDVFRISKLIGNSILTQVDKFRSDRRYRGDDICYRPIFTNMDIDYDSTFFLSTIKKEMERTKLSVFLCHSVSDKEKVSKLYTKLINSGINAWMDKENLIGGQDWKLEIELALKKSDIVLICLTKNATTKVGFVQKEIKYALDKADEFPEGMPYIMPIRLEECMVPERLKKWYRIDYFKRNGFSILYRALKVYEGNKFSENTGLLNYQ